MCHKLFDKSIKSNEDVFEILMKLGYRQFRYQEPLFNLLARSCYIYFELWNNVPKASDLNVLEEIKNIIGVPYHVAIAFVMALVGNKDGYFFPYSKKELLAFGYALGEELDENCHVRFLKWCSSEYKTYHDHRSFLNPLYLFPIIDTKTKPRNDLENVFIIASYINLYHKITTGIYYCLIDKFNYGSAKNVFKEKYGYVFESYVGILLKEHLKEWTIVPEIRYKKGKNFIDSVDWLVMKNDKLLLIEVKQSSVFLKSKMLAKLDIIKQDLKKTLIKAVKQLERTYTDIKLKSFPELSQFFDVNEIRMLIVTNDPFYNANSIGKKLIAEEIHKIDFDYDIINICEFETLLDNQLKSESLFDILSYKNLTQKEMDFKEYILEMYPNGIGQMHFLKIYYDKYFSRFTKKEINYE
jgi:hypothetical protein